MRFLAASSIAQTIESAIRNRAILRVNYCHVTDGEEVEYVIAPFDVGSTNPNEKIRERNRDNLYAYSFTHVDDKKGQPDPKVCPFNINRFAGMERTGETFDENELASANLKATKYDYRKCKFAVLPDRDWFGISR